MRGLGDLLGVGMVRNVAESREMVGVGETEVRRRL